MLLIIFLYMLFAITFTIAKAALFYVKPIFFIGFRMITAGVILLGYLLLYNRSEIKLYRQDIHLFCFVTLFHIYGAYVLEFIALQNLSSAKTCLLYSASPFFTALIAYLFLQEKMNRQQFLGLIVGFMGFVPLLADDHNITSLSPLFFISASEFILLCSVLCASSGWIAVKKLTQERHCSPIMINGVSMFLGGVLALATSLLFESSPYWCCPNQLAFIRFVSYAMALIIISNIICYNLYGYLLRFYSTTFLAFAGFMCPFFSALFGQFFLQESISFYFLVSLIMVSFGLYLFYKNECSNKKVFVDV